MMTMSPCRSVGSRNLLDIGGEAFAVDRAFEQPGRGDAVVTQRGQERHSSPAAVGDLADQTAAARRQPRSGAMLVLVQVSSMKTRRAGINAVLVLDPLRPAGVRRQDGRVRQPPRFFFEAQLLVVDKGPDRAVVNLQTAFGQFAHQSEQGEVVLLDPRQKPRAVLAARSRGACSRRSCSVPRCRCSANAHPPDRRADADAKLRRGPMTRKAHRAQPLPPPVREDQWNRLDPSGAGLQAQPAS